MKNNHDDNNYAAVPMTRHLSTNIILLLTYWLSSGTEMDTCVHLADMKATDSAEDLAE